MGKIHLVMPAVVMREQPPVDLTGDKNGGGGGGGGGGDKDPSKIDPIIQGLLSRLPKSGDVWPEPDRKLWLQLLEGSFKLIYKDTPQKSAEEKARELATRQ
jgi:hypothetical protein